MLREQIDAWLMDAQKHKTRSCPLCKRDPLGGLVSSPEPESMPASSGTSDDVELAAVVHIPDEEGTEEVVASEAAQGRSEEAPVQTSPQGSDAI